MSTNLPKQEFQIAQGQDPVPQPPAPTEAVAICNEIQQIMATYRKQEDAGGVGTPGGLEHMGDVWRLLRRWDAALKDGGEGKNG